MLLLAGAAQAQEPRAVATLSPSETSLGETVQLQIKINRVGGIAMQPLRLEGVQIRGSRSQTNISMGGARSGLETTLTFSLLPEREGEITIPALTFQVEGRAVMTEPLKLTVGPAKPAGKGGAGEGPGQGFLEVVLPKETAYVGETIPVEVRLHVSANTPAQPETMPQIQGEGYTVHPMREPREEHGRRGGREYKVWVFRTAITPSRAGKIKLGPVQSSYIAQVPRAQRNRPRSMLDFFDEDILSDPFFAANQRFQATAEAVELTVKPLPAADRPRSFSGAIGQFKLEAKGSPDRVKVGDPVTMQLSVSGRGNFDRMEAPILDESAGWRSYPPGAKFKADDDLGISGTKTFEVAAIPEQKTSTMPAFAFSYFDPAAEKYVELKSQRAPLTVEGSAAPPAVEPSRSESPDVAAASSPAPTDILGLRYDLGRSSQSLHPLYERPSFWAAQSVPLAALLTLLWSKLRRTNQDAPRLAGWRREKAQTLARLRTADFSRADFLAQAARVIQLETAEITGSLPESVDASTACNARPLDEETAAGIDEIFDSRAELLYAGAAPTDQQLSAADRSRVLETIDAFRRTHARH
jgi:hypothetical protein